jgi:TctA family transporter
MSRDTRNTIIFFACVAAIVLAFFMRDAMWREKIYAMLAVVVAGISGFLAITKRNENPPAHVTESHLVIYFRKLVYSDENMALFLVQV